MAKNAAVETLEHNIRQLESGIHSIPEQQEDLARQKDRLKQAEQSLARDKRALLEYKDALALLQAGEV